MSTEFSQRAVVAPNVMFRAVGDESVILNLDTELYIGADPVGTAMWVALIASDSIQLAYESLLRQFEVVPGQLREDLDGFVQNLLDQKLIELTAAVPSVSATTERPE